MARIWGCAALRRRDMLTRRQTEALCWLAEGKTFGQIAAIMGISSETARSHFRQARERLDAMNRSHAVAKALRLGLIK